MCKRFDPTNQNVNEPLKINLSKTKLKRCDACKDAVTRREAMVVKFEEPK